MSLEDRFGEYFSALDRSGGEDRCYVCRRTPAEVKAFFGFEEDGLPREAEAYGLEDVVLGPSDVMTYLGVRPCCAVCQLNVDAIAAMDEGPVLLRLLREMLEERARLWPEDGSGEPESVPSPG